MNIEEQDRTVGDPQPLEGATLLALRPVHWGGGEAVSPPGVVLDCRDVALTMGGWCYLRRRLDPLPPDWPIEGPGTLLMAVKCLVLAVGMQPPPRFGEGGWLVLSHPEEVASVSALTLNRHGLHFLNHAHHERYARRWPRRVAQLRDFLERHGLPASGVLIGSGPVLELYGIRLAREIEFLSLKPVDEPEAPFRASEDPRPHLGVDQHFMIEDDRYHFEVDGLKFIAFETLRRLKQGRHRLADRNDLTMMRALEKGGRWRLVTGRWLWWGLVVVAFLERESLRLVRRLRGASDR